METNKVSHEIDVIALTMKVLKQWKTLLGFIVVFGAVGVVVALCTPKEYTAKVVLAPEMSSGGLGLSDNLADMASSFGIDLGGKTSMDAIYPEIYPDIFSSTDFMYSLFNVKVRLQDDNTERTYIDHIRKETKIPFWDYPKIWLAKAMEKPAPEVKGGGKGFVDSFRMSKLDLETCEGMSNSLTCLIDKKTSEISISVRDQDPMVAAIMADTLQRRLQAYITDYRTKKARADYAYYDKLMKEADAVYNKKKGQYAGFTDSHRNTVLTSVNTQEQSLKDDMGNAYELYASFQKMRDQAQAKIQERTPAFTMIQSAKMPYKPSSRPKAVTVLIFVILGCIIDAAWVLAVKTFFTKRKEKNQTQAC